MILDPIQQLSAHSHYSIVVCSLGCEWRLTIPKLELMAIASGTAKLWPWTWHQIDFSGAPYGGICVLL